jgi:hypothetical protein
MTLGLSPSCHLSAGSRSSHPSHPIQNAQSGKGPTASDRNLLCAIHLHPFIAVIQGFISEIHGCISTGKEANVYHAFRPDRSEVAIKIYKTSILVFKDRDRYVSGEYRFRSGYSKSNPRKMVKVWAEKETRNLRRLHAAGLPCPNPLLLRLHGSCRPHCAVPLPHTHTHTFTQARALVFPNFAPPTASSCYGFYWQRRNRRSSLERCGPRREQTS